MRPSWKPDDLAAGGTRARSAHARRDRQVRSRAADGSRQSPHRARRGAYTQMTWLADSGAASSAARDGACRSRGVRFFSLKSTAMTAPISILLMWSGDALQKILHGTCQHQRHAAREARCLWAGWPAGKFGLWSRYMSRLPCMALANSFLPQCLQPPAGRRGPDNTRLRVNFAKQPAAYACAAGT